MSIREQQLEKKLREIVADVNAMRVKDPGEEALFGYFASWSELCGEYAVEWPNLDILIRDAEEVLSGS